MAFFKEELNKVKAFLFDVDGVFSSEKLYLTPDGDMMRTMSTKDGFAIQHAVKKGFIVGIITGGWSEAVKKRFNGLGVTDVYLKSTDKHDDYLDFMYKHELKPEDILYMGDDLPDYNVMKAVGLATCPVDAAEEIKSISDYISDKKGGEGCVRDIVEQVMRATRNWEIGGVNNSKPV